MQRHRRRQRHRRADPAIGGATLHPAVVDMGGRGAAVGAQGGKEGVEAEVGRVSVIGNPVRYPLPEHVEGGRPSLEEKEKRCFDKLSTNGGKVILRSGKSDRRAPSADRPAPGTAAPPASISRRRLRCATMPCRFRRASSMYSHSRGGGNPF